MKRNHDYPPLIRFPSGTVYHPHPPRPEDMGRTTNRPYPRPWPYCQGY